VSPGARPSFGQAPRQSQWVAFLLAASALSLLIGGITVLELVERCGRGTDRDCFFSLAPSGGSIFVGKLLCVLAIVPAVAIPLFIFDTVVDLRRHPERQVPWHRESTPQLDLANSLEAPVTRSGKLRPEVRFRIEAVLDGLRGRCTVVGMLTEGGIQPPMNLRLLPGPGSPNQETVVRVVAASGASAGPVDPGSASRRRLTLVGVGNTRTGRGLRSARKWWIDPGDELRSQ
jgi:hypothetical protein